MKYAQIIKELQTQIADHTIHSGDKVPSIRETALRFHCSKATVIRAYQELEAKHVLYSVPQSGYFVVNNNLVPPRSESWIDFASMLPEPAVLPHLEFRHCMNQALDLYQEKAFLYHGKQGLPDLRTALAKELQNFQIFVKPENVTITAGAQEALDILVRMPFPNGKTTVLVEQPTYAGMLKSLRVSGVTALGIARDEHGIDFDRLENLFRNGPIKFFYTMSRYHNPTGTSYTPKEKAILLDLARRYDVYIVEDDYLAEFNADTKSDPLYALDNSEHVIYVKSYAKVFLPGLRLGAVLLPQPLQTIFLDFKACVDPYTSGVLQGAFGIFVKSGMYARHVKKLRNFYAPRIDALVRSCSQLPSEVVWHPDDHCAFLFLELPSGIGFSRLAAGLQTKHVLIQGGDLWYLPGFPRKNGIRLCIYQTDEQQIAAGISLLAAEIKYGLGQPLPRHDFFYEI